MEKDREQLRNRLIHERKRFNKSGLETIGKRITERLTSSESYRRAGTIHCFSGATEKGEISTRYLLSDIIRSQKKLVMPRMTAKRGELEHIRVHDTTTLKVNKLGIGEPVHGEFVSPEDIDLILVPGLAVDQEGIRIGYGGGYYDRFLTLTKAMKVMLVPDIFVLNKIPAQSHDVPVEAAVTELRWITFRE